MFSYMEHSFSTSLFRQLLLQKKESDAFSLSVPTHNLLRRIEAALLVKHKNKYLFCKEPSPLAAINNTSSSYAVWAVLPMDSLSPLKLRRQITRVWLGLAACLWVNISATLCKTTLKFGQTLYFSTFCC